MAAQNGRAEVVKVLMEAKALVNIQAKVTSLLHISFPHDRKRIYYYWKTVSVRATLSLTTTASRTVVTSITSLFPFDTVH